MCMCINVTTITKFPLKMYGNAFKINYVSCRRTHVVQRLVQTLTFHDGFTKFARLNTYADVQVTKSTIATLYVRITLAGGLMWKVDKLRGPCQQIYVRLHFYDQWHTYVHATCPTRQDNFFYTMKSRKCLPSLYTTLPIHPLKSWWLAICIQHYTAINMICESRPTKFNKVW